MRRGSGFGIQHSGAAAPQNPESRIPTIPESRILNPESRLPHPNHCLIAVVLMAQSGILKR